MTKPVIERFEPYEIQGKSWGTELVIAQSATYLGKVLFMKAGRGGALQFHQVKDETFHLFSGEVMVEYPARDGTLTRERMQPGQSYHVPPGAVHRVTAVTDCVLFECSTPHFDDRVKVAE